MQIVGFLMTRLNDEFNRNYDWVEVETMKSQVSFQNFQVSSEALPESENEPEISLLRPHPSLLQFDSCLASDHVKVAILFAHEYSKTIIMQIYLFT